jgi:hypothetical protein
MLRFGTSYPTKHLQRAVQGGMPESLLGTRKRHY